MLTEQPIKILKCFSPERLKTYEKVIFWVQDKESTQQPKPFGPLNKKNSFKLAIAWRFWKKLTHHEIHWTMLRVLHCLERTLKNVQDCDTKEVYHSPDSQQKIFSGIKVRCQITFIHILINLPLIVSNMKLYESDKQPSRILRYDKRTINIVIPSILDLCSSTLLKKHYFLL